MKICDEHLLDYPCKVLSDVINDCEKQPWRMFVNMLSSYVDWLNTHSIGVAIISLMIAVELKYTERELFNIGLGAFLHDVGKLLISRSIIEKPGTLTDIEMKYMRLHCELGTDCLESFSIPEECREIVLQHHERLDGSGYPKGLKEDHISRNARIVMIADVVDAIISDRPYRANRETDAAMNVLKSDKEKYFQEYVSVLEKILK